MKISSISVVICPKIGLDRISDYFQNNEPYCSQDLIYALFYNNWQMCECSSNPYHIAINKTIKYVISRYI